MRDFLWAAIHKRETPEEPGLCNKETGLQGKTRIPTTEWVLHTFKKTTLFILRNETLPLKWYPKALTLEILEQIHLHFLIWELVFLT